ncbi:MAG: hypothetical protein IT559_09195 [Alphaproteobacteria bacterium]|nr:hypothetical protein [Alphaproteobacteria bacterium]
MRICALVTSTALVSALVTSSALVRNARAEANAVYSPSTQWAVTQVGTQGEAYCALARRYSGGTVMTIAQNAQAETSFALDFQSPLFQSGQMMNIVLDPGAGQQRNYEAQPVSGRAFVVRLGRDAPFFEALERTGMLRVEAAGRSYHFTVSDLRAGQDQMNSCVVAMTMPAAGEESPQVAAGQPQPAPVMPAPPVDEGASYRQEINMLRRQIAELTSKNQAASEKASLAKKAVSTPAAADTQVEVNLRELSIQLQAAQQDNESLRRKLESVEAQAKNAAPSEAETAMLRSLQAENNALKTALNVAQQKPAVDTAKTDEKVAALQAEVATLRQDKEMLEKSLAEKTQAEQGLAAQLKAAQESSQGTSASLTSALENARAENETLRAQLALAQDAAGREMADAQGEKAEVTAMQQKSDSQIAQLQANVKSLEIEMGRKDQEIIESGRKIAELQVLEGEVKRLRDLASAVEAGSADSENLRVEVTALKSENSRLADKLAAAELSAAKAPDLSQEVAALRAENSKLKLAMQGHEETLAELTVLREENARLQEQVKKNTLAMTQQNTQAMAARQQAAAMERKPIAQSAPAKNPDVVSEMQEPAQEKPARNNIVLAQAYPDEIAQAREMAVSEEHVDVNEAQRQERMMRENVLRMAAQRQLAQKQIAEKQVVEEPSAPFAQEALPEKSAAPSTPYVSMSGQDAPLSMRRSEDPFAEIKVPEQAAPSELRGDEREALAVSSARAVENLDSSQGLAVAPSSALERKDVQRMENAPSAGDFKPDIAVQDILAKASVAAPGSVERVAKASGAQQLAYQWQEGGVFGTAEQRPMSPSMGFDEMVKDYLMRAQGRCPGEFAVVPDDSVDSAAGRADSYEIACVGGAVSSGASLLFFKRGETFTVVAHEAPAENLDAAMGRRDRVKKTLVGS